MLNLSSKIIFSCFILFFLFSISVCLAQNSLITPESYKTGCIASGDCEINDFVRVFIVASNLILGVTGSLALLAFIAGGIMFLISAGSSERVTRAKQILLGAVIGLVIVFTSFMIIQFVYKALGLNWQGKQEFPNPVATTNLTPASTQTRQACYNDIYAQIENCVTSSCLPNAPATSPCYTACVATYDIRPSPCDSLPQ